MSHVTENRQNLINRARRIAGQLQGVERLLGEEPDCARVLQQVAAIKGAINGLMDEIISHHLDDHVARAGLSDEARRQGADELMAVIRRYAK